MPGYKYDLFGKYYKITKGEREEITQQEYIKQTGESSYLIDKLKYSVWPFQINDYVFLKIPNYTDQYFYAKNEYFNEYLRSLNLDHYVDKEMGYNLSQIKEKLKIFDKKYLKIEEEESGVFIGYKKKYQKEVYELLGFDYDRLGNGYAPVDWQLSEMVKYLWKNDFIMISTDYNKDEVFIILIKNNEQKTIDIFSKQLGEENMIVLKSDKTSKEHRKIMDKDDQKYSHLIRIYKTYKNFSYLTAVRFSEHMLKFVNDSFGLSNDKPKDVHRGNKLLRYH
jgi:hypothetical protein